MRAHLAVPAGRADVAGHEERERGFANCTCCGRVGRVGRPLTRLRREVEQYLADLAGRFHVREGISSLVPWKGSVDDGL